MANRPLGVSSDTVYLVETNYPHEGDPEEKVNRFSTYNASTYTHVDNPGSRWELMLINTHESLFGKRRSGDTLSFDNVEDAVAVADFLTRYGRLTTGWSTDMQEQHRRKYRGALKVRVVEEHTLKARRLIETDIAPPKTEYEIELEALKAKHGRA